ncbi:internal virion protein [Pteropox virus]|uniref:Internal virion protein n=1 Tax=Pteropox virus TaxID=1873698 RepID=A0A1B1MRE0_9POXV|nr:internal virion protein [Pteropox virus]ANS71151.1 internal virion protein [Pteropox virus]
MDTNELRTFKTRKKNTFKNQPNSFIKDKPKNVDYEKPPQNPKPAFNQPVNKIIHNEYKDYIDNRICEYYKKIPLSIYNSSSSTYSVKHVSEEEASCWIELSSAVVGKFAVNFPLVIGSSSYNYGRTIFLEEFPNSKVSELNPHDYCVAVPILFQLAVALYCMYKKNIYADCLEFLIVTIPRTTIVYSINQMIFSTNTDSLLILSKSSRLFRAELPQSCYLNYIKTFYALRNWKHFTTDYFFEWLLRNHFDYFSKQQNDLFKHKKKNSPRTQINKSTDPGTLVYVSRDDSFVVGVTLTNVSINENIRIMFSSDGLIFEVDDFNINDVYFANELFVRSQLSAITV